MILLASLFMLGTFVLASPVHANGKGGWDNDKWDDKWYKRGGYLPPGAYHVPYGQLPPPEYRYGGGVAVVPVAVQPQYAYGAGYYPYDVYPAYQAPYGAQSEAVSYSRTSTYSPYGVYY